MRKHFRAPPETVLAAWQPLSVLDATDVDEQWLLEAPRPTAAHRLLDPPLQLTQAVCRCSP